jgi:hypothetical protein
MLGIARDFSKRADDIIAFLDIISTAIAVAKVDHRNIKSRSPFISSSKRLKARIVKSPNFSLTAYDGSFLTVCAEYEMTIRKLIDKFVLDAAQKCTEYHHLPKEMRDWYPDGCSNLILNITQYKNAHLTKDSILQSLVSCQKTKGYSLLGEAFFDSSRNFWPAVIEEMLSKRIGLSKVWQKISRQNGIQSFIGTNDLSTVERQSKDRLEKLLQRRNDIIHRGRSYYTPSDSEIRDAAKYLTVLIDCLANVMKLHFDSL